VLVGDGVKVAVGLETVGGVTITNELTPLTMLTYARWLPSGLHAISECILERLTEYSCKIAPVVALNT